MIRDVRHGSRWGSKRRPAFRSGCDIRRAKHDEKQNSGAWALGERLQAGARRRGSRRAQSRGVSRWPKADRPLTVDRWRNLAAVQIRPQGRLSLPERDAACALPPKDSVALEG